MFVDAHMHVNFRGFSADGLVKYLDENGMDLCWLLTWEEIDPGPWHYEDLSIEDVWDAFSKYPSRIIPMYAPDPTRDDAPIRLESWCRRGVGGCGELKATVNWRSPQVRSMLDSANDLGIPVVFHMEEGRCISAPRTSAMCDRLLCSTLESTRMRYAIPRRCVQTLVRVSTLKNRVEQVQFPGYMLDFSSLERVLMDFPRVNFVAHGPMFWKHMYADSSRRQEAYSKGVAPGMGIIWRLLQEYRNLYADLSGPSGFNALRRDPNNARTFLSLYEDKLLYGTDNYLVGQKQFLESLRLGEGTTRKILGGNAVRLAGPSAARCNKTMQADTNAGLSNSR